MLVVRVEDIVIVVVGFGEFLVFGFRDMEI